MACSSCDSNASGKNTDSGEAASTEEQLQQLRSENLRKDSLILESITYYNEIERNLSDIQLKEDEIKSQFELLNNSGSNNKDIILRKIRYINDLRLENARKFNSLQHKLDTIALAEDQFREIISRLRVEMSQKDKQIDNLRKELEIKGKEYATLFNDYKSQVKNNEAQIVLNRELEAKLNTVYYAAGSMKELKKNNVLTSKGLLKKAALSDNLNESYFTRVSVSDTKEISFYASRITLMTNHNSDTYTIVQDGKQIKLRILDPVAFWKTSRYLVILTQ